MFRMLGNKVELIRYKTTYLEDEIEVKESCISEEHKNEIENSLNEKGIEFTTIAIDQTENEWFNGLEFNSYDEASSVFIKGEEVYNINSTAKQATSNDQLRADTDYIAIMSGVVL